jgi:hypothetical protein
LYAKLLVSLEVQALQDIVSRPQLQANGVLLLWELVQSYRPKNVPEVLAAKTGEFWSHTKCLPTKSIDTYQFHELLSAMHHFIFTLGPEFAPIQHNIHFGNLPVAWHTTSWPELLLLCRDYYNSVNPFGVTMKEPTADSGVDQVAHHKKVKQWFLNPSKYCRETEMEQKKYLDKCIFHLSKSHSTEDYNVKKECDKINNTKKSSSISYQTIKTENIHHITEDVFEDAAEVVVSDIYSDEVPTYDTNEDTLLYFVYVSTHYLHLVKASQTNDISPTQYEISCHC